MLARMRPWVQVLTLCSFKKTSQQTKRKTQSSLGNALNTARSHLRSTEQVDRGWTTAATSSAPSWLFMTNQHCSALPGCVFFSHLLISRPPCVPFCIPPWVLD